jgi:hypothetical protein
MEGDGTAIEVTAKFFPLAFLFFLTKPRVTIDETPPRVISWRRAYRFDVSPGLHTVKVAIGLLADRLQVKNPNTGANSIELAVAEGATARVSYNMPPLIFLKGSLKVSA